MPAENLAAKLVTEVGGLVLAPEESSLADAADWVDGLLGDPVRQADIGADSRALAEREFELQGCADRFETVLTRATSLG
jgi:hypothetical protein